MKFEDAVVKSIRNFMRGKMPKATSELMDEGRFYTPEYFDELEEAFADDEDIKEPEDEDV
ncbi:MAG: hypothetical protein ACO3MJ_07905 [Alphaproteobacteria bacterium]|jgi:hypothetical protein